MKLIKMLIMSKLVVNMRFFETLKRCKMGDENQMIMKRATNRFEAKL